jgi:metal-responsive CopG/Arc/MetJ family transcriptional regulator
MAKVMVSLPDDLLRQLDAEAQQRGTTRSGLLRSYVEEGIHRRNQRRAERMRQILAEPVASSGFGGDSVDFLRAERERRLERLTSEHD